MHWDQIRSFHPDTWLVVEALQSHSDGDRRVLDRIAVIETCPDGGAAFRRYRELHRRHPARELYFVHTSRDSLDIRERPRFGGRGDAASAP